METTTVRPPVEHYDRLRNQIDATFEGMATDADYQEEAKLLAEEFAVSDWDAWRLAYSSCGGSAPRAPNFDANQFHP